MSVQKIIVEKQFTDEEMMDKEGDYIDESDYSTIIDYDADVFTNDGHLLLKFRKNVIPKRLTQSALDSYRKVAMKRHDNRGPSAGPLDKNKLPSYVGKLVNPGKYRTHYVQAKGGKLSKHNVSNLSPSNIVGYFDKKDRNLKNGPPCRLTAFSSKNPEKWENSIPFLQCIDGLFKRLVPDRYKIQKEYAEKCGEFIIPETCFSTITVNYSWRTGLHKDRGDLEAGFGNLIVCEDGLNPNQYKGCYTGFPQYGVCVDVRDGDFLAMDVHEWHCNTEFKPVSDSESTPDYKKIDTKNLISFKQTEIDNHWHLNRMSIVCYLRKNMIHCESKMKEHI